MVVLYLVLLLFLVLVHVALRWRVARLEKRYVKVAAEADNLLKQVSMRPGNSNRPDPMVQARQQFDLAVIAVRRDRVEERYTAWQSVSERFGAFLSQLAGFRGRFLPYFAGLLDLTFAVALLDWYGLGVADLRRLLGL